VTEFPVRQGTDLLPLVTRQSVVTFKSTDFLKTKKGVIANTLTVSLFIYYYTML